MNSKPATTVTTISYGGKMESIHSTAEAAEAITTTTTTISASSSSLSHLSNSAIGNLTANKMSTSTSITAIAKEFQTPNSIRKVRNGTLHSFPIVNTPTPPSRFRKIVNPFESNITERLHLPLIDSPSLFHRPETPQMCSTQLEFEWTIDEVSSLNPANVEAYETQFVSSDDPEIEAKAQAAISTFFKERIIVPSPDDCPLRDQKIILGMTATSAAAAAAAAAATATTTTTTKDNQQLAARVLCDNSCQTELTLPPILPKHVEDALRPFFTYTLDQQKTPSKDCDCSFNITMQNVSVIDHDARDASLRRKLFQTAINMSDHSTEYEREVHLDSPAPKTPEMQLSDMRSLRFMTTPQHENLQDENERPLDFPLTSNGRESFSHICGNISPISKGEATTPKSLTSSRKKDESLSSFYRSTPDHSVNRCKSFDMTTDNAVNCSYMSGKRKSFHLIDERSSDTNETVSFLYDDEMQLSYGSQQHPQTPQMNRSKRRCNSVNRKNLSRSFNQIEEQQHQHSATLIRTDSGFSGSQNTITQSYDEENHQMEGNFTFHNIPTMKSCDISMASIN